MCQRKLSHINIRQLQTVLNIKIEQYEQLFYQPKPSQASRGGLRGSNLQAWPNPNFSEVFFGEASSVISCPRSTIDSPRAIQASIWANRNRFSINQNHPRHLWPKFKKSEILTFFEIGQVTLTPRGSIGNFNLGLWDSKCKILHGYTGLGQKMA